MGTNYYWCEEQYNKCVNCGHEEKIDVIEIHIGKSSGGWVFGIHVYPDKGINILEDWIKIWCTKKGWIRDEYMQRISITYMLDVIMDRSTTYWDGGKNQSEEWYQQNFAQPGPNGLARSRIGYGCVDHGENEGTWDYCTGDFS